MKTQEPLILTVDFGTQSVRVGLFNKSGECIDIAKHVYEHAYFSTKPGYVEQNPDYYYKCFCIASNELISRNNEKIPQILGLSMVCFRDTAVCLDENNQPVCPAILWLDERLADQEQKIPAWQKLIFNIVGMRETVRLNSRRSRAVWLRQNQPDVWAKVAKYMTISTYLTMKLTGRYADSPANYAGHFPINFKKRQFYKSDKDLLSTLYGIPRSMLCELVPVGEVIGEITEESSKESGLPKGLKVYSVGSDKGAETIGLGVLDENTAAISYGTGCSIEVSFHKYRNAELFLPSYPAIVPGFYNAEVLIYRGYWMLNWFAEEFANNESLEAALQKKLTLDILNEEMLNIAPGSDGLVLQPYWGPELRRPLAKGAIIGFSDKHTKIHLYRAIIEGIAYACREGLEFFERMRLHHKVKEIRVSGGGSKSDAICQITSDIFGLPVSRVQTFETSSLGAAVAGFVAAKEFSSLEDAIGSMVHKSSTFEPNMENHKRYDYLFYHAYVPMYPRLHKIYKKIKSYDKMSFTK